MMRTRTMRISLLAIEAVRNEMEDAGWAVRTILPDSALGGFVVVFESAE